jgi:hypothetical protein
VGVRPGLARGSGLGGAVAATALRDGTLKDSGWRGPVSVAAAFVQVKNSSLYDGLQY